MNRHGSQNYLDTLETLDEADEDIVLHEGVQKIYDLLHDGEVFESPIDINIPITERLDLPPLSWHHMDLVPKKAKLTNSGHTVIISAKWFQERPYISSGPLLGNYVFSQLHFHWGENNMEGSEHTISGSKHPLEMHAVFFRSCYLTQESALKKKDGLCVTVYMFVLQDENNPVIEILTDVLYSIKEPHHSVRLKSFPLEFFLKTFSNDYFLYAGSVNTASCLHYILWFICREPMGISIAQIEVFRALLDVNYMPLTKNSRPVQPRHDRPLFHVNPSGQLHTTLILLQKEMDSKMGQRPQQVNKYPRSSKEYSSRKTASTLRCEVIYNTNPFLDISLYHTQYYDAQKKSTTKKMETLSLPEI